MNSRLLAASALALLLAACGGGDTPETQALVKAGNDLQAKVGAPGANAQMPGREDPAVKAFDAEAEKALAALGTDALPVDGLESYDKLCGPATKIVGAYASAGVGTNADGSLQTNDPAKVAQMNANVARYMDQMFTPLLFSAHCTAVHLPEVEKSIEGKVEGKKAEALGQIRGGAFGQAAGLLQMSVDPTLDAARRRRALDLVVRDAGNFAVAMTAAQRQQFVGLAQQVGQQAPDLAAQAGQIRAAVEKAPCGKLCGA